MSWCPHQAPVATLGQLSLDAPRGGERGTREGAATDRGQFLVCRFGQPTTVCLEFRHQRTDVMVRRPKRDVFLHQQFRQIHGSHEVGPSGSYLVKFRRGQRTRQDVGTGNRRVNRVEQHPFVLLKIAVVSERQCLEHHVDCGKVAQHSADLSPYQLGDVGVAFLWHGRRTRRPRVAHACDTELCR